MEIVTLIVGLSLFVAIPWCYLTYKMYLDSYDPSADD